MKTLIALLRAVNVGGTGKLPMADLVALATAEGFGRPRTYIASGNLVFETDKSEAQVKAVLKRALHAYAGKPIGCWCAPPKSWTAPSPPTPFRTPRQIA